MIDVKEAYKIALDLSPAKHLHKIKSFPNGYGFIFNTNKNEMDLNNTCLVIDKDGKNVTNIPIIFETLALFESAKDLPLTTVL